LPSYLGLFAVLVWLSSGGGGGGLGGGGSVPRTTYLPIVSHATYMPSLPSFLPVH